MLTDVNRLLTRNWTAPALVVSFLMVVFFEFSETQNGIFANLSPEGLSPADASAWSRLAYDNWWASRNNPFGYFTYHITLLAAAYVIVLQNIVGLLAVLGVRRLKSVAEFDADWLDSDGKYGWKPFSSVFRTVYLSLLLHGVGIAILLLIVGTSNFRWLTMIIVMWLFFVASYVVVPWATIGDAPRVAIERRVQLLRAKTLESRDDLITFEAGRSAIKSLRSTRFTPLGYSRPALYPIFVTIVLPVALSVASLLLTSD